MVKKRNILKRLGMGAAAFLTLLSAVTVFLPAQSASAINCQHLYTPSREGYAYDLELHFYSYTPVYTIPTASDCHDINITNVYNINPYYPNDHCMDVRVRFYPTSGGSWTTPPAWNTCSTPPNGPWIVIASNVINGTHYRLEWNDSQISQETLFTIWH